MLACHRTSPFTFFVGIPFERALFYHKLCAYLTVILGGIHGLVAWHIPPNGGSHWSFSDMASDGTSQTGLVYIGGFMLLILTSLYPIRRSFFECFYYLHLGLVAIILVFGTAHGAGTIWVGALFWVADLIVRYIYMAGIKHTKVMTAELLPGDVIRLECPRGDFEYAGGQYIFVCLPGISCFEWHPFSLSSAPHQKELKIHVRALGNWTKKLLDLVKEAPEGRLEMKCWFEGPFGNPECEIWGGQYKTFLMVSGGIGITPLQSITNQLLEQAGRKRPIKHIRFVWAVSDKAVIDAMYEKQNCLLPQFEGLPTVLPPSFQPDILTPTMKSMANEDPLSIEKLQTEFYLTRATKETLHSGNWFHTCLLYTSPSPRDS
eukprot:TRINITY_DN20480_c0_g1_i3.p1 TRINITY_DN20480_c0_g1~~TRINITY_DN20480_c0_g1_i3.p1  ORF type:complete len:375 (-),score=89.95 TRINITY_DN20480_c0_g1_i3:131-1255(-)